jgi:hypothetical protein
MSESIPSSCVIDQNASHGFGSRCKEVTATLPPGNIGRANQVEICLMNQGCGIERMSRGLSSHPCGGKLTKLVVEERHQLGGGLPISSRSGIQ